MGKNGTFSAFVVGAIVGAAVAILYAPKSGKETRDELLNFYKDAETKLKAKSDELKIQAQKQIDKIKETANVAIEEGKKAFEKAKSEIIKENEENEG